MPVTTSHRDTRTRTLDVGGTRFAYRDLGPRTGTPVDLAASHNSADLAHRLPNAHLTIYPDAGHGGIFNHRAEFVPDALDLLAA